MRGYTITYFYKPDGRHNLLVSKDARLIIQPAEPDFESFVCRGEPCPEKVEPKQNLAFFTIETDEPFEIEPEEKQFGPYQMFYFIEPAILHYTTLVDNFSDLLDKPSMDMFLHNLEWKVSTLTDGSVPKEELTYLLNPTGIVPFTDNCAAMMPLKGGPNRHGHFWEKVTPTTYALGLHND